MEHPGDQPARPSKNALKRQIRAAKRLQNAEEWKLQQRQRRKERRATRKDVPKAPNPDRISIVTEGISYCGQVAIDLEFMELMSEKEIKSLSSQIMRCYSLNRRFPQRFHLKLLGLTAERLGLLKALLPDMERWDLELAAVSFSDHAASNKVVYLTADSEHCLESLEEDSTYVIGGLVDHNRFKKICFDKAASAAIPTARLPILEHVSLTGSKVLTIVNVYESLLRFKSSNDWEAALQASIPKRKVAADPK